MLDTRITEELGRARQTVEFVLELREQAVVNNQKELWFGFSERTALLASLLTSLSMERIEVLTSSTKKQSQFYKSVSPKVKTLERYRIALMTDALEKIDRELYSYSHKETIEVP